MGVSIETSVINQPCGSRTETQLVGPLLVGFEAGAPFPAELPWESVKAVISAKEQCCLH